MLFKKKLALQQMEHCQSKMIMTDGFIRGGCLYNYKYDSECGVGACISIIKWQGVSLSCSEMVQRASPLVHLNT